MVHLNVSQVSVQVDMLRNPARLVPPEQRTLFARAIVEACDQNDGVKDGIVGEPRACKFDPGVLACRAGDSLDCLTAPQVENARSAYAPVMLKGAQVYPGRSPGFESGWRIPTPGEPLNPLFTDMVRYVGRQDPDVQP
jgi:feruloyl esterase